MPKAPGHSPFQKYLPKKIGTDIFLGGGSPIASHIEKTARIATLKRVSFFAHLSEEAFQALADSSIAKSWSKGEIIFMEGNPCPGLFVVHSGAVKIFKTSSKGREQVLTIEVPGRAVAELAVLDDGPYPASAMAIEDATLLLIQKSQFHDLCLKHPEIGFKIISSLAGRFRKLVSLVEALAFLEVGQRLAKFLIERAHQSAEAIEVTLDMSNQELASHIGTVRELVSRSFSRFQDQEILSIRNRTITILNMERLKDEAEVE